MLITSTLPAKSCLSETRVFNPYAHTIELTALNREIDFDECIVSDIDWECMPSRDWDESPIGIFGKVTNVISGKDYGEVFIGLVKKRSLVGKENDTRLYVQEFRDDDNLNLLLDNIDSYSFEDGSLVSDLYGGSTLERLSF